MNTEHGARQRRFPQCFLNAPVITFRGTSCVLLDLGTSRWQISRMRLEPCLPYHADTAMPDRHVPISRAQAEAGERPGEGRSAEEAFLIKCRLPFCKAVVRSAISQSLTKGKLQAVTVCSTGTEALVIQRTFYEDICYVPSSIARPECYSLATP